MLKNISLSAIYATVLVLFFAIGAFAQMAPKDVIKVGDTAPDFTLSDNSGNKITLSEAVKTAPVVLVFYRGSWCPFCVRQLSELRSLIKEGEKTMLYAISIDSADKSKTLIKNVEKDGKGKINFSFLSDRGSKTIDAFGLRDPRYKGEEFDGIPYPTVYVIGKDRKVAWMKLEEDYRFRPTNMEIRAELEKLNVE